MITQQPKFQVKYGTWSTDFIIVDSDELEKLHYAKRRGAFFTGKYGDVDTTKIISIRPDFKETYGAMPEYELTGEDYDEIESKHGDIRVLIGKAEERVRLLVEKKQEHLIGTNAKLPELDKPTTERRGGEIKHLKELLPPNNKTILE